jgi:hypothetical protein
MTAGPRPDLQPQSWKHSVYEYLAQNNVKCSSATPLEGGHSTYIWRLENVHILRKNDVGSTIISDKCVLEFAESTSKLNHIPFPPERLQWESRALNSHVVGQACALEPSVCVSRTLFATKQALVLDWAGDIDLRTAILVGAIRDESAISSRLGKWLAHMHEAGLCDKTTQAWKNNGMAEKLLTLQESSMRDLLAEHKTSSSTIEHAITTFRQPAGGLETGVLLDFRPMNVLLSRLEDNQPSITVIDMECSTYGDPALDLNLWLAEALIIEAQSRRKGVVSAFLTAYAYESGPEIVTRAFVCKVAVLLGALRSFSSFTIWDVQADAAYWRLAATEYIQAGAERNLQWLVQSDIGPLLRFDPEYLHLFR